MEKLVAFFIFKTTTFINKEGDAIFNFITWVVGDGSILFAKNKTQFEVYNDIKDNLINLFKVVKEKTMGSLRELSLYLFIRGMTLKHL